MPYNRFEETETLVWPWENKTDWQVKRYNKIGQIFSVSVGNTRSYNLHLKSDGHRHVTYVCLNGYFNKVLISESEARTIEVVVWCCTVLEYCRIHHLNGMFVYYQSFVMHCAWYIAVATVYDSSDLPPTIHNNTNFRFYSALYKFINLYRHI